ncbi:hypothetical protein K1T71_005784 [Dendrolimus kikuchii]|uniref:Uncharacterized protein n=1 Tax=Dendrolimus kikuchii TaxID=765133 RepID=A0ACC1D506_9NEOP|nr:hypothetical protein K1T71_005784 [Dendrolimus kikuchii]
MATLPKSQEDTAANIQKEKNNEAHKDKVEFEDLLSSAGELGTYQILMFFATFPFYTFGVFSYYGQLFMTEVSPNHWCWIPELENLTVVERMDLAIPKDNSSRLGYSRCTAYDVDWKSVLDSGQKPNYTWNTVPCEHGWEFNKSEIPYSTISSELGWVCEKDNYQATAQAIYFVGSVIGGLVVGWVSDRFGRLPAAIASNIFGCIGGVLSTFAQNFVQFAVCRLIVGMSYDNCMMMAYLIVLEYVSPKYKTIFANLTSGIFYTVAVTALPWLILVCGHWKVISLAMSLPLGLVLLAPFYMPESSRWLLSKGRVDEAVEKIITIGRINKKQIPPKMIEQFKLTANVNSNETHSFLEIFKRPSVRNVFIYTCLVYMSCVIVFDGLIRSIGNLNFDFFVAFSVVSVTEFPSLILVAFTLDIVGRRWLTFSMLIVSCLFCFISVFAYTGLQSLICAVVARFAVNASIAALTQWAVELLPTSVRGSGTSILHTCGYVASVLSPYIVYLNVYIDGLPLIILSSISAIAAFVSILIPETGNRDLPHTFSDVDNIYKDQKIWQLPRPRKEILRSE